jgi:hypothetical protein
VEKNRKEKKKVRKKKWKEGKESGREGGRKDEIAKDSRIQTSSKQRPNLGS